MLALLLISFFTITKSADQNYVANWTTGNEVLISNYTVQQSKDTVRWNDIKNIAKGKSSYTYILPKKTAYYRIKANGKNGRQDYYTPPIFMNVGNNVTLSSPTKTSSTLSFTTTNESNVDYYFIEKTSDGKTYSKTTSITATGDGRYTYKISKTIKTYTYRITTIYKDGNKTTPQKFK